MDKKNKGGMDIKPFHVKNHLWVFVNSLIENPAFDSQTKETLTTKQSKFGSKCELSDSTVNKVVKSGVVDLVLSWAQAKQNVELGRKMGAKTANSKHINVPKLEDANEAGGKNSERCTLILTEGDSALDTIVTKLTCDHVGKTFFDFISSRWGWLVCDVEFNFEICFA